MVNPARDVRGPDRGHDRASSFLFPAELHTLLERAPFGLLEAPSVIAAVEQLLDLYETDE